MGEIKNDSLEITWLCQGGFLLEANGLRVVIDPYLSDALKSRGQERMVPAPLTIEELRPGLVCFTHDHADHFDEQTVVPLAKAWPGCHFAGPTSTREHYARLGLNPRLFMTVDSGMSYVWGPIVLKAVPAWHTDKHAVGMVICFGGKTIYLSGDTEWNEQLVPAVQNAAGGPLDLVIICINGKLGNMTDTEAETVVEALTPPFVIPMHYGLFANNTIDPQPFAQKTKQKGIQCVLMQPGIPVKF